jgi:hypothetical protein
MVIPFDKKPKTKELISEIRKEVKKVDPKINSVVTCDDQYTMISTDNE